MTDWQVVRDDGVHVCAQMCSSCIFRNGNLMHLRGGRVRGMIDEALAADSVIPCHRTIWETDAPAICRGFFDRHARDVSPLRLALMLNAVVFDEPPGILE